MFGLSNPFGLNPFSPKSLFLSVVVVIVGGGLCIVAFYTTLAALTIEQLPFGREVAWLWMLGKLPATEVCLEDLELPSVGEDVGPGGLPGGLPVEGVLTFRFHDPNYTRLVRRIHKGVDVAAPAGTPVFSTISGKVVWAGWNQQGYGNLVAIQSGNVKILLAHNSKILVEVGQQVKAGQQVAEVGSTGRSTGSHVHYEVWVDDRAVDPLRFAGRPGTWTCPRSQADSSGGRIQVTRPLHHLATAYAG